MILWYGGERLFDKMWINEYIQMNDVELKSKMISWDILSKEKENKERKRQSPKETKKLRKAKRKSDKKTFICMYYIIQSYANLAICNQTASKEKNIRFYNIYSFNQFIQLNNLITHTDKYFTKHAMICMCSNVLKWKDDIKLLINGLIY